MPHCWPQTDNVVSRLCRRCLLWREPRRGPSAYRVPFCQRPARRRSAMRMPTAAIAPPRAVCTSGIAPPYCPTILSRIFPHLIPHPIAPPYCPALLPHPIAPNPNPSANPNPNQAGRARTLRAAQPAATAAAGGAAAHDGGACALALHRERLQPLAAPPLVRAQPAMESAPAWRPRPEVHAQPRLQ